MTRTYLLLLCLLPFTMAATPAPAVWVYPGADAQFKSPEYRVVVIQNGQRHESFVYADKHQDEKLAARGSDWNHWTTFSFNGPITVEVTALKTKIPSAQILPSSRGIKPTVSADQRSLTFSLEKPAKLWAKIPGTDENPLFIFADPPEENIPSPTDKNVLFFGPGIHSVGEKYQLKSGQTVYLAGGAYVKGTLTGQNLSDLTIRGRGILSGIDIPRKPNVAGIPWNMVQLDGPGKNQLIEGITVINPPHFCLLSRGEMIARNTKLFGWWHQTDGWGGGDNSIVEDTFMKVNDDHVKLYNKNQIARHLVIYQQINGAVLQLGWSSQSPQNCHAHDIDIIRSEPSLYKITREANQPILNHRHQEARSVVKNILIERVRIEDNVAFLVGFNGNEGQSSDITLRDIHLTGKILSPNFLRTKGNGSIKRVRLENITVENGQPLPVPTKENWGISGDVELPTLTFSKK